MAYGLKYKASKTHENGDKYEVRIYRDGWTGASYGIGNLTRLSLSIQGDTAALTAPIIKTSLNIGMIDTPDKGSTKSDGTTCVDANGDKVGKWEEFYTNNPTLYKVELRYTGALTRNAVIWTGFLTPDSWGEDMTYGGTISLVARDMLGTLSEYEFDLTGDVTITQIVQGALTKCKCAMTATMRTSECLQNAGNSQSILAAKINASTFAGKSWYEALEQTLEGVGLILRYDGNNGFDCTSIRYAASHAVEGGENAHTPAFYNRSGYRTLDPAVKQIVEVFNPSIESIAPVEPGADDWTDTGQTLTQHYDTPSPHQQDFTYPEFSLVSGSSFFSGSGAIPYLDENPEGPRDVPKVGIYFPVNLTTANRTTYKDPSLVAPFSLNLSNLVGTGFVELKDWGIRPGGGIRYTFSRYFFDSPTAASVSISVSCRLNGTTYYWYKGWGTSETFFDANFDERITIPEKEGATDYAVNIRCINASSMAQGGGIIGNPLFVPLGIRIEPIEGNDIAGEYKTTTIYDEENHIEINRTPSIGAINSSTPAAFLPNVLHYGTTPARDRWRWAGENSAGLPLAVVIHQQLLVFNCAQNGNSIFTGDLLDLTSGVSVPGTNYDYFTRSCALLAGDYNCLSGYIEGVTLREIYDWDDVWDGVTPEYTEKESQAKGGTAASGGGGSTGGGGGSSHTHANKEVLDGITAEKVTSWDGAVTLAHSHDNKTILDGIASTDVNAWDDAASKAHEHANKTILDAIQEASITHWDAAYSHSQIGVAATTPSGNPHNTTWAQINSASGNAKILTDYIADNQVTIAKLESALSWLSHCHYSNGTLVLGDENNAINFAAYGEVTAGGVGSGGSGGSGALYTCADVTAYNNSKVGRSTTEGAQVGDLLAYDGTHWHAVVAPATGVTTFNGRSGQVTLTSGDVEAVLSLTNIENAIKSLQSQIDSVASRNGFDELIASAMFADTLVGTNIYGALHGNADSATNADTLDGQHASYFQPLATAINTGNIASQSVAYATNANYANGAGNADTVDSEHASAFAHRATWNNLIHSGNEFTYASAGYNGVIWHNYRTASGSTDGNITDYYFGNGKGGSLVALSTLILQSSHGETAYNDLTTVSKALQSLQSQVDSVASRDNADFEALEGVVNECFRSIQSQLDSIATRTDMSEINAVSVHADNLSAVDIWASGNILAYGEVTAGQSSDSRFKDNQSDLRNVDWVLKSLRPMEFDWNDLYHSLGGRNEGHDVGFLAQDVQPLIPSAISKVYGDYLRLDYYKITPYLVAGWQSHETRIEWLERENQELKMEIQRLRS